MSGRGSSFITVKYLLKLLSALHNSDWVSGEQTGSAFVMIVGIFHEWIIIQRMDKHPNCVEIACLSDQITHFLNLSAEDDTSKTLQQIWWKDLKMRSFSKVKNDISASTFNPTWMRCPWSTQNKKRKKKKHDSNNYSTNCLTTGQSPSVDWEACVIRSKTPERLFVFLGK